MMSKTPVSEERSTILKTPIRSVCRDVPATSPRLTPRQFRHLNTPASVRKTPGDRFIPSRTEADLRFSAYKVRSGRRGDRSENDSEASLNPDTDSARRVVQDRLLGLSDRNSDSRVLSFKQTPVSCTKSAKRRGKYEYWSTYGTPLSACSKKTVRRFPKAAEKVLDAPNLINDFYLNVVDWSKKSTLAIALGGAVYLLDTESGSSSSLCSMDGDTTYVSSLQWNKSGKYLAVGSSDAEVQLWDVSANKLVRRMRTHNSRVSSMSWNPHNNLLSTASQSGAIHNYDARLAQFHVGSLNTHTLDVCGLRWSPNGRFLASGSNDNLVCIWDTYSRDPWSSPTHVLEEHTAAVKALSWCPWQPSLLATGGGSADRHICLWNACTGKLEDKVDTGSQISGLVWSSQHHELLSSHGHPHNQLTIWSYPSLSRLASLKGHEARVLQLVLSPDGQTVASAGADETLRFWKCFTATDANKGTVRTATGNLSMPALEMPSYIR